jgi:hypothetical protein
VLKVIAAGFALTLVTAPLAGAQTVGPDGTMGPPPPPSALDAPDRTPPGAAERMAPPNPYARLPQHRGTAADPGIAGYPRNPMAGAGGN